MTISITTSSYDDPASLAAYVKVIEAVVGHDMPGFPVPNERLAYLWHKHDWAGRRSEHYLAWLDGELAGRLEVVLPTIENLNNMSFDIEVMPAMRRRGVGSALWRKAIERAQANDRTKVMTHSSWSLPGLEARDGGAGPAFAAALGFQSANLPEVMRRLDLSTVDHERLDDLLRKAKGKSSGYRVMQWQDTAPEDYLDDVAYLDSRLVEDAPMGDLAWEPEKVDAERVRKSEKVSEMRGNAAYHTGVVHEETDSLVAWTTLSKNRELGWHAWQQITIVEPRHRGHRLGALVKVENLRYFLREAPEVRMIDTFNAAENSYMISINEEMGFRPLFAFQNWQRDL